MIRVSWKRFSGTIAALRRRIGKGSEMTRIGILGYGNLGRGVELAIRQNANDSI